MKKKTTKEELLVKIFVQTVSSATTFGKRFKKVCRLLDSRPKLSDDQWLQIWRGMYYSVCYTEMGKGGEELIQTIGGYDDKQMLLIGFQALTNDWFGIDVFRLDKYMLLARVMVNTALNLQINALVNNLEDNDFEGRDQKSIKRTEEEVKQISDANDAKSLSTTNTKKSNKLNDKPKEILFPMSFRAQIVDKILSIVKTSIGLSLHISDIFIDELSKSFTEFKPQLKSIAKIDLYFDILLPFVKLMAITEDYRVLNNIKQKVFDKFKNEVLIGESVETRKQILQKLIESMIDIGGVEAIAKRNRDSIYDLIANLKTKLNQLNDSNVEKGLKRKEIQIGSGRRKRIKVEVTASSPFVRSIVPIPVL